MSPRSSLATALLAASLVLLAGCSLTPGETPTASPQPPPDVEVSFTNAASATYDAEVLLLPRPADRARVTFANGSTTEVGNLSGVQGVGLYGPPVDGAALRDAEPLGVDPLDRRVYRGISPRSSVSSTFESPPRNASLFVVVTGPEGVSLWATATCGENDHLNAFDAEIHDVGPGVSVGCESFRASSGTSERG